MLPNRGRQNFQRTVDGFPTVRSLFIALLAMAGDLGGALGPAIVGNITQNAGNDMQKGMLSGCAFPLILMVSLLLLNRAGRKNN